MVKLEISVVKDGQYLGITDGKKVIMIRDAFGGVVEKFSHLIPVFEGPEQYVDIMPPDLYLITTELEASIDTIQAPNSTEPLELHPD